MFTNHLRKERLYKKNLLFSRKADKYLAKLYIKNNFSNLIKVAPLIYVGRTVPDLDNYSNHEKFIIKPNNSTGKSLVLKPKKDKQISNKISICNKWLLPITEEKKLSFDHYENFYKDIDPMLIIEKFINIKEEYKFHVIHGKVCYIEHLLKNLNKCKWYTRNWDILNIKCLDDSYNQMVPKNPKLDRYIEIVEKILEKDKFNYVRFDTYIDYKNNLYFGEYTFTPGSFKKEYQPIEFDNLLFGFLKNKKINFELINEYINHNKKTQLPITNNENNESIFKKYMLN